MFQWTKIYMGNGERQMGVGACLGFDPTQRQQGVHCTPPAVGLDSPLSLTFLEKLESHWHSRRSWNPLSIDPMSHEHWASSRCPQSHGWQMSVYRRQGLQDPPPETLVLVSMCLEHPGWWEWMLATHERCVFMSKSENSHPQGPASEPQPERLVRTQTCWSCRSKEGCLGDCEGERRRDSVWRWRG